MNDSNQTPQPDTEEPAQVRTDIMTKVSHLTLILSECAQGNDIVSSPSAEGGIILNQDERDELIELMVIAEEELVPNFYDHHWPSFLVDYTQVLMNATVDFVESKGTDEETDIIADVRAWFETVRNDGRPMISSTHLTLFPMLVQKAA
jgi:hypothetical protein